MMKEVYQRDIRLGPFIDEGTYREFRARVLIRGWTIQWAIATFIKMVASMGTDDLARLEVVMREYSNDQPARRESPGTQ